MGFHPASYLAGLAVLLSVQHSVSYYNRESGLLFDAYPKQKLSLPNGVDGVHPNKSVSVKDKMDCVFACINVPWCRSVNFQTTPLKSGLYFCQLLSSEQFAHKEYMKKNRLYLHYSVKILMSVLQASTIAMSMPSVPIPRAHLLVLAILVTREMAVHAQISMNVRQVCTSAQVMQAAQTLWAHIPVNVGLVLMALSPSKRTVSTPALTASVAAYHPLAFLDCTPTC
ncbi:hypothetical protein AC249_AIPGENE27318 [Exaiptasia diaphana]|nr:hypothetical protein AC249_AIPGENE27318 [Exaiptasia diaphana]